jgi:glycosyltransferase involved in cell wall biosynthesis
LTPLRVLIELSSADLRVGAVNDALDLAELARPTGTEFVLCGPLDDRFCAEAARRGLRTERRSSRAFSRRELPLYAASVLAWIARLRRWRVDVVHLNYPGYGPSLACAARVLRLPVVGRAGGPFIPGNLANRWVAAYVANCPAHAGALLGSPLADRVVVTGDLFRPGRVHATLTAERPLPARRPGVARVVFLGQLVERKGLDVLLRAFAAVQRPADLLLVGGDWSAPGFPQSVRRIAREAGIEDRVHFENHRPDVGAVLATADVFVLPSLSDARPRSIIEAMSLGIPVVASDVGGIPSLVAHGETGYLVPPGDAAGLAAALERLIGSEELRKRLGDGARAKAERDCRPDQTALACVRLYHSLVSASAGAVDPLANMQGA